MRLWRWRFAGTFPDLPKAVLVVAPHTSNWDFIVGALAMLALGLRISWLGKHTLFRWPLGTLMRRLGGLPVRRDQGAGTVGQAVTLFDRHDRLLVALAPEGTRRAVARWRGGFSRIAAGAGVPAIPIAFDWARREVRIGTPVGLSGDPAADERTLRPWFADVVPRRRERAVTGAREDTGTGDGGEALPASGDPFVTGGALRDALLAGLATDPDAASAAAGARDDEAPRSPVDPLVGAEIGHYLITGRLGVGGMGVVYRAVDNRLSRPVALKFLPVDRIGDPHALERFDREARAISALNHPNICVLYEVGSHVERPFIALELLIGETLEQRLASGPLDPDRALEIGAAIAAGLDAAHEAGLVHRDVKPANVFITRHGHAKILDFGIAKLFQAPPEPSSGMPSRPGSHSLTHPGTVPGTLRYMSPEQIRGQEVGPRSDVFSLGAVLYEMLAGRPAFPCQGVVAISDAILSRPVPSLAGPGLDRRIDAVVQRALAKDPARRWEGAGALREALEQLRLERLAKVRRAVVRGGGGRAVPWRWLATAGAAATALAAFLLLDGNERVPAPAAAHAPRTLAVAPFDNLSPDARHAHLAFSVPNELTNELARAHSLAIRPFSEAHRLAAEVRSPAELGRRLDADEVVTGQIYVEGDDLRLTLELIDAATESITWRESLSLPAGDLIAVREALSGQVRLGLLPALGVVPDEPGSAPRSDEAYRLYLESLPALNDPQPNARAIELLEQSVALDRGFAPAWSALGRRRFLHAYYWGGGEDLRTAARDAVERALAIDPDYLEAVGTLVDIHVVEGRVADAYAAATATLAHRPRSAYAMSLVAIPLRYSGLLERATAVCDRGLAVDPGEPALRSCTFAYMLAGDYQRAGEVATRASSLVWHNDVTARMALMRGHPDEARRLWSRQVDVSAGRLRRDALVAWLGGDHGETAARRFDEEFATVDASRDPEWKFLSAGLFATCGFTDRALALLAAAVRDGYCVDPSPASDPLLQRLAGDRRLAALQRDARECRQRFARRLQPLP